MTAIISFILITVGIFMIIFIIFANSNKGQRQLFEAEQKIALIKKLRKKKEGGRRMHKIVKFIKSIAKIIFTWPIICWLLWKKHKIYDQRMNWAFGCEYAANDYTMKAAGKHVRELDEKIDNIERRIKKLI